MLGLLLCAVLSEALQPGVITQAATSYMARAERTYKAAPNNFFGQLLITLFRIGTWSMALFLCFYTEGNASGWSFAALCGLVLAMLMLKMLCNVLLDYTFQLSRHYPPVYEHYSNLLTLTMLVVYPSLLFLLRLDDVTTSRWTLGIILAVFCLVWLLRCLRVFLSSPMAIVYIILYFLTVEVLPLAGLIYLAQMMLTL